MILSENEKQRILGLHLTIPMKPWLFEQPAAKNVWDDPNKFFPNNKKVEPPLGFEVGPGGVIKPKQTFNAQQYNKGIDYDIESLRKEPPTAKAIYGPMPKDLRGTKEGEAILKAEKNKINPETYEEFVENLRGIVYHPISVGVEIVISMFGIGRVAVAGVYGFLLSEDFRKASNGDYSSENMFNMLVDLLGVVFSGAYTGLLVPFRSAAKGLKTGIKALIEWLATLPIWSKLKPILNTLVKMGKTVVEAIKFAAEEFAESSLGQLLRLGSKGIYDMVKTVLGLVVQLGSWILKFIGLISESLAKLVGAGDEVAKKINVGTQYGVVGTGVAYGIEKMMGKKSPEEEMVDKLMSGLKIANVVPSKESEEQAKTIKFD